MGPRHGPESNRVTKPSGWRAWQGCLWVWGGGVAWHEFRYGEPESRIRWNCHDTMTFKLRATHLAPPAYAHLQEFVVLSGNWQVGSISEERAGKGRPSGLHD